MNSFYTPRGVSHVLSLWLSFTRERVRFLPGFCQKQKLKGLKSSVAVTSSVTNPQKDLSPEVSICHADFYAFHRQSAKGGV